MSSRLLAGLTNSFNHTDNLHLAAKYILARLLTKKIYLHIPVYLFYHHMTCAAAELCCFWGIRLKFSFAHTFSGVLLHVFATSVVNTELSKTWLNPKNRSTTFTIKHLLKWQKIINCFQINENWEIKRLWLLINAYNEVAGHAAPLRFTKRGCSSLNITSSK